MAQPKRRKPGKRKPEQPADEFAGFTEKERKIIAELYQSIKKIVRKKRRGK
jgi:hypothetical protein